MARAALVLVAVLAVLAAGCGSDSGGGGSGAEPAATEDSAEYRAAVNELFDRVVAARGDYEDAQGAQKVRAAGQELDREVQAALEQLKALHPPPRAQALQAQLNARLADLHHDLAKALAAEHFETARLGDAVRETTPADRVVNAINALP